MNKLVEANTLRKDFRDSGNVVAALKGVSLAVEPGELVVLMGASGSGKSTLLHLLAGLDRPTAGTVCIGGTDLSTLNDKQRTLFRRRHIGVVFQAFNLLPTLSAIENIALPAELDGSDFKQAGQRAEELLSLVGLAARKKHRPQAMSGGEQQRVAIARALMNDPLVVLADEPTGNLDTVHSESVWRQLAGLVQEHGKTVVAVTHEPTGATFADRVLVLKDGLIIGEIRPGGEGHASLVAARYTELVG
ncbi:MAG: ABC transporter ATP-binding protein [Phycisphaerae bacterium]